MNIWEGRRFEKLLRVVSGEFPDAEVVNPDGSREILSTKLLRLSAARKQYQAISRQLLFDQQLPLDFGNFIKGQVGGGI